MNKKENATPPAANIGDAFALELQELRRSGKIDATQPLLRIDYRREAARAPFQFDMARGILHRTGCAAIPRDSRSAVYAVWKLRPDHEATACIKCRPVPRKAAKMAKDIATDIVFGLLSILDQFGSVLSERGREYRNSDRGRQISKNISELLSGLDQTQKEALDVTLSSLDNLLQIIKACNSGLEGQNGDNGRTCGAGKDNGNASNSGNGHKTGSRRPKAPRKTK